MQNRSSSRFAALAASALLSACLGGLEGSAQLDGGAGMGSGGALGAAGVVIVRPDDAGEDLEDLEPTPDAGEDLELCTTDDDCAGRPLTPWQCTATGASGALYWRCLDTGACWEVTQARVCAGCIDGTCPGG